LGNEGIANAAGRVEKDAIFKQFETGMRALVERSRQHNMVPIVTLCYTRNDFTGVEYEYTRRMNLAINSWDVPSVNFLGAVDDGHGRWAEGFWNDALHPNASGHFELLTTFVPTLFDALDRGKPTPVRATGSGFVRVTAGPAALSYAPEGTMHPFAVGLTTRASSNAQLATVEGRLLKAISQGRNVIFQAGERATAGILVQDGVFAYRSTAGELIKSTVAADASWHQVVLSHYTARGETLLFVDGTLAVSVRERLETSRIVVGPTATTSSKPVDVKDFLVYRSALNADEVAALKKGTLVQASLDVYAPLADASLARGAALENRAQSLAALRVGEGSLTHLDR
jgi:hypothetical protein